MSDDSTADVLISELVWARSQLVATLAGFTDRDVRRPLTVSGTNLLGLVTHLTMTEAVYLGSLLGRPCTGHDRRFDDPGFTNRDSLWVHADVSRDRVLGEYARVAEQADSVVRTTGISARGTVPWWPRPETSVLDLVLHVLDETARHTGQADILREHLVDGAAGCMPGAAADVHKKSHWEVVAAAAAARTDRVERA